MGRKRMEGNQASLLGCYWLSEDAPERAKYWAKFGSYDSDIPDQMSTGSHNIPPRIMVAEQRWHDLAKFFDQVYRDGFGGNEIGSPLYEGNVYGCLAIAAVKAPQRYASLRNVFRIWTAFLAVRSTVVRMPRFLRWNMGGEPQEMRVLQRPAPTLWTPPAGMRAHPWSIAQPGAPHILATILDLPRAIGGRAFDPTKVAKTLDDWNENGTGLRMPRGLIHTISRHRATLREILGPLYDDCRTLITGNYGTGLEALRGIKSWISIIRVRKPLGTYMIERGPENQILAAWSGKQTSVQKSYCVAASHRAGTFDFLCPSAWNPNDVIATPIKGFAVIGAATVEARAKITASVPRLRDPDFIFTFHRNREPTVVHE